MRPKSAHEFYVVLFPSINDAIRAEKSLKEQAIPIKLIPVPRQLSSDCGVCLRFHNASVERVISILQSAGIRVEGVFPMP